MALIRIREQAHEADSFKATLIFEGGEEYPITIQDPFSEKEERLLEWYFEEYLEFPFIEQVTAQQAGDSVTTYGEKLFQEVFADKDAYSRYHEYLQVGLHTLQMEIAGEPPFHALHWEALKDPKMPSPLALQAPMIRKNLKPQTVRAKVRPSPTINLLVVTARPFGEGDVGYRTISRPLVEGLRKAQIPVRIDILRPATYRALVDHLEEVRQRQHQQRGEDDEVGGYYHVIHFDVHGALLTHEQVQKGRKTNRYLFQPRYGRGDIAPYEGHKAFLFLEGERDEQADLVEAAELANLLVNYQIPIVILNACQSGKQLGSKQLEANPSGQQATTKGEAEQAGKAGEQAGEQDKQIEVRETSLGSRLMQAGVQVALAMGYSVTVSAAQLMMRTLYEQLFRRRDLSTAIGRARQELYNNKGRQAYFNQTIDLEDWLLPVVYQNQPASLRVREFTPEEASEYYGAVAERYEPKTLPYGFVGRDLDILHLEKRLLTRCNLVLVRGMGGAGKTTLLQHLGEWWQTTGLVKQVFYFGYDEKAWNRQQLLDSLARKLLSPVQYVGTFQPLGLNAQQAMIAQRLRSERHLLILDNLESITGQHMSIQNTLPPEEQQALKCLLHDLVGGRTLVLLGSRSSEDWLAEGSFASNVYDLGGLDPEAASMLADLILERHTVTKYRQDADLRRLIKLLDGFPLALEVVLANLARQTPKEVLAALQAGDVNLQTGDSQQRTRNILRCIDYSHRNLSPAAQHLLLCLAPFTSVVREDTLQLYTARLQQQPALANLPFDRWSEVLREAQNWGLLSRDADISIYLHMQPTLPYFLRNRLQTLEQAEVKRAIETAFREYYDQYGNAMYQLIEAKDPQERQIGLVLTQLEYENLMTALQLALADQVLILTLYLTLSNYLDATQDHGRGQSLDQLMLQRITAYPLEKRVGLLGEEFIRIFGTVAIRQLKLRQYTEADAAFQEVLKLADELEGLDEIERGRLKATTYHNLGNVAQEQRQWPQAEQYYQQALQIYIEFNDRYEQASTYHQLGNVAQEQRQWPQAEQYYQQALQIYIEFNDRYEQASTYHQLGNVAQKQRQWPQAEQYYQQALQIYIEFNDRYEQAGTYHQLGRVAQEQRQWPQARNYLLRALETFVAYDDDYSSGIAFRSLVRLWRASGDGSIVSAVANVLNATPAEVEETFREREEAEESE
jgi:tetratricopeptide (TPR) repeat protein